MTPDQVAVLTVVAGRHEHLARQLEGLRRSDQPPGRHVVVAMGDPGVADVVAGAGSAWPTTVTTVPVPASGELPLAAARNAAAAEALALGAGLLVFLDVDCIPAPGLVGRYAEAAARTANGALAPSPVLLSGPVHYLPPPPPGGYDLARLGDGSSPHPARPAPADGALETAPDLRLFWSLSFAVTAQDWATTGGFHEAYTGYGGEDTDLAAVVAQRGGSLVWVGGATAFHQHHPVQAPPVGHLTDIVRNANLFHRRWGWFPMGGWLQAFADRGLAHLDTQGETGPRWVEGAA